MKNLFDFLNANIEHFFNITIVCKKKIKILTYFNRKRMQKQNCRLSFVASQR